jgi:hypothetical protein
LLSELVFSCLQIAPSSPDPTSLSLLFSYINSRNYLLFEP